MEPIIDGGEQAVDAQDSTGNVQPDAQPTGQGDTGKGPSPWAKDLEGLGLGEYSTVVDKYLAEKWQPRMTQLEQQYAPFKDLYQAPEDAKSAADLLYSLRENPRETYEFIGQLIEENFPTDAPASPNTADAPAEEGQQSADIPDEYKQLLDDLKRERQEKANEEQFKSLYQQYQKDVPGLEEEWFAKLILANGGDVEAAIKDYTQVFPDRATAPEQPPPTIGDGQPAPPEEEPFDGDLGALVKSVIRKSNAKN